MPRSSPPPTRRASPWPSPGSGISVTDAAGWALAAAGPFFGSFLGLVADRWPERRAVLTGRSRCDGCGRVLGPLELVPLLSYAALGGRCRGCGAAIPPRLPAIEAGGLAVGLAAALAAPGWIALGTALLGWTLLLLLALDARHHWLPLRLTLPLIAGGLIVSALIEGGLPADALFGAAAGFLSLEALRLIARRLLLREAMGGGDPILLAAAGAWVGWQGLPAVLLLASATGIVSALAAGRTSAGTRVPLGAHIALATFAVWCLGLRFA